MMENDTYGLRAAYAAEAEAQAAHNRLAARAAQHGAEVAQREKDRDALLASAAAGVQVKPSELRRVDNAIADARAALELSTAPIAAAEAALKKAKSAAGTCESRVWANERHRLEREAAAAEEESQAAQRAALVARNRLSSATNSFGATWPQDVIARVRATFAEYREHAAVIA